MESQVPDPVPSIMRWRFKQLKKLLKETVTMTPNNGQATVRPGQRIIVDLPFNSTVDLSTFTWFFKGQTTHLGAAVTGTEIVAAAGNLAIQFCGSRFFPRNSSSVIQSMQIKINGGIKVDIPDYNFVYNMLYDYTQGADALKRRSVGGENADPSNKQYIVGSDIIERRGYSVARFDTADDSNNDVLRDRQEYCVRSWLSLLGGNASTNVIDTQMLGIVTIELVLAPAAILMQGTRNQGQAVVDIATSSIYRTEVNRPVLTAATAAITAAIVEEAASYSLSDLQFRIVRYLMPPEFYQSLSNTLGSGGVYKLWFPNYSVYTGNPVLATNKNCTTSFSISTKSLDYVIGTFRLPNYDVEGPVLNTRLAPLASLEYGATFGTADNQIDAGLRRVFNQSKYFAHNGDSIKTTQWKVGNTPYESQDLKEQFNSLMQHFNIHQDTLSGMYPGINSLGAFREHSYASIVSLNIPGESEMYTVSGLDTEQTPATIEWKVVAEAFTANNITTAVNCTPYLIAAYNSHIEIKAGRVVSLIP
jgi:hypothetical protein